MTIEPFNVPEFIKKLVTIEFDEGAQSVLTKLCGDYVTADSGISNDGEAEYLRKQVGIVAVLAILNAYGRNKDSTVVSRYDVTVGMLGSLRINLMP